MEARRSDFVRCRTSASFQGFIIMVSIDRETDRFGSGCQMQTPDWQYFGRIGPDQKRTRLSRASIEMSRETRVEGRELAMLHPRIKRSAGIVGGFKIDACRFMSL